MFEDHDRVCLDLILNSALLYMCDLGQFGLSEFTTWE